MAIGTPDEQRRELAPVEPAELGQPAGSVAARIKPTPGMLPSRAKSREAGLAGDGTAQEGFDLGLVAP